MSEAPWNALWDSRHLALLQGCPLGHSVAAHPLYTGVREHGTATLFEHRWVPPAQILDKFVECTFFGA